MKACVPNVGFSYQPRRLPPNFTDLVLMFAIPDPKNVVTMALLPH